MKATALRNKLPELVRQEVRHSSPTTSWSHEITQMSPEVHLALESSSFQWLALTITAHLPHYMLQPPRAFLEQLTPHHKPASAYLQPERQT